MKKQRMLGVTLIEILLVLVIISTIIYLIVGYLQQRTLQMRTDRASLQMQQILNAGLAYYVANGRWPGSIACLQQQSGCTQRYLPNNLTSPWGQPYTVGNNNSLFYVYTPITTGTAASAAAQAAMIAGKLPLSYTTRSLSGNPPQQDACNSTTCYPVGAVNVPAQNLNNATAVNFAGIYHHGGCVPVPNCPRDANGNQLQAQIYVVPLSVSGVNGNNTTSYPLISFTGYARGGNSSSPGNCDWNNTGTTYPYGPCGNLVNGVAGTNYWRACLDVVTTQGRLSQSGNTNWGSVVSLGVFTRCGGVNEQAGSNFNVWSR